MCSAGQLPRRGGWPRAPGAARSLPLPAPVVRRLSRNVFSGSAPAPRRLAAGAGGGALFAAPGARGQAAEPQCVQRVSSRAAAAGRAAGIADTGPVPEEHRPDYRFSLANERTFLAWLRTGL